jgi:hypothetical protein
MGSLPKNLKPHIGQKKEKNIPPISSTERKKVIQEMTEIIRESNKIIAKYRSSNNETLHE